MLFYLHLGISMIATALILGVAEIVYANRDR